MIKEEIMNRVFALMLLLLPGVFVYSQAPDPTTFPSIAPPSPDAQSFMRYGAIPVDYSTGVPKIEIPLYEVRSGQLSLPLSLSYHAAGVKVNDIAGVAGLGWKLNAGGVLTRTVKGFADDNSTQGSFFHPFLTTAQINTEGTPGNANLSGVNAFLSLASAGNIDGESDNYFYAVGDGTTGQFVFDNAFNINSLQYTTNKIIRNSTAFPLNSWYEVISDNGTKYYFDQGEMTSTGSDPTPYASSWWLSKIISADNSDTISFQYQASSIPHTDFTFSQSYTFGLGIENNQNSGLTFSRSQQTTTQLMLTQINFRNGSVVFSYAQDRIDMQLNRLTGISIFSNVNNQLIKKYTFGQSYFWSGYANDQYNNRLRLDNLNVFDGSGTFLNNYVFSYNQDNILPPYNSNPVIFTSYQLASFALDYWGFYNGQVHNANLLPTLPAPFTAGNRDANGTFAQACILNKITYPTGGYTSFEYESNVDPSGTATGGLRVHRILSQTDASSTPVIKRYVYGQNILTRDLDDDSRFSYQQTIAGQDANGQVFSQFATIYMDNPIVEFETHDGSFALYQTVDEFTDGLAGNNLRTTYVYESENDLVEGVNSPRYQDQYFTDRTWRRGQLIGTNYFKLVNGNYQLTRTVNTTYSDFRTNTLVEGVKVQPLISGIQCNPSSVQSAGVCYYYFDEPIEVGSKKMTTQQTADFDNSNNTTAITRNYTYASPFHLYPTSIVYTDSKQNTKTIQYQYPNDFAGTSVYDEMIARNTINPVIATSIFKNNTTLLQTARTNYQDWGNGIIAPVSMDLKVGANPVDTRVQYFGYDSRKNILAVAKSADVQDVFIWGYNNAYPVAEIKGASYAASTAFVNMALINSVTTTDAQMRTELNKIRTGLAGTTALVTTYTYTPLVGVTSRTDPAGRTEYYEYDAASRLSVVRDQFQNVIKKYCYSYSGLPESCSGTVIFSNGAVTVPFTRNNCPSGFQGSTVNYGPSPGTFTSTVSQADADQQALNFANANNGQNGQTYANMNGVCTLIPPPVYSNVQEAGFFTRNNCGAGFNGGNATLTVPAGTYTSLISQDDANQQALDYISANGQAYANSVGLCFPIPTSVDIPYSNFTSFTFNAVYTNVSTGMQYTFTLATNVVGGDLGQIPFGTYNISITPTNGSSLFDFNVGSFFQDGVGSWSMNGVNYGDPSSANSAIDIDLH
jgi:YD repeat-containing protein